MSLQDRINTLIAQHGLTRQEVAEISDVSTVTVHKWLSGKAKIKEEHAKVLAEKLWVDWLWLQHGVSRIGQGLAESITSSLNNTMVCRTEGYDLVSEQMGLKLRHLTGKLSDDQAIGERLAKGLSFKGIVQVIAYGTKVIVADNPADLKPLELKNVFYDFNKAVIHGSCQVQVLAVWTDTEGVTRTAFKVNFSHEDYVRQVQRINRTYGLNIEPLPE